MAYALRCAVLCCCNQTPQMAGPGVVKCLYHWGRVERRISIGGALRWTFLAHQSVHHRAITPYLFLRKTPIYRLLLHRLSLSFPPSFQQKTWTRSLLDGHHAFEFDQIHCYRNTTKKLAGSHGTVAIALLCVHSVMGGPLRKRAGDRASRQLW